MDGDRRLHSCRRAVLSVDKAVYSARGLDECARRCRQWGRGWEEDWKATRKASAALDWDESNSSQARSTSVSTVGEGREEKGGGEGGVGEEGRLGEAAAVGEDVMAGEEVGRCGRSIDPLLPSWPQRLTPSAPAMWRM